MAAKSSVYRLALLRLVFNNTALTGVGDAGGLLGSAAAGSLYLSFHTADPKAGTQATSEVSYTGYARKAIARSAAGFTIDEAAFSAKLTAGQHTGTCTVTPDPAQTITHFGIGTAASGAGKLLYAGPVSAPLAVSAGIRPTLYGLDWVDPALAASIGED